jgi:hypothetical protein
MLEYLSVIFEYLKGKNKDEIARICAYFLAPVLVLGLSLLGFFGGGIAELDRPIAISELRTQITREGLSETKRGVVLIAEPTASEYRIPLGEGASRIWSSLDEEAARANADRLELRAGGLNGRTPFIGVDAPVTIVVDGDLGKEVQVLGGKEATDDWRLTARRSNSLVSSVLAACFFAFGVSLSLATTRSSSTECESGLAIKTTP